MSNEGLTLTHIPNEPHQYSAETLDVLFGIESEFLVTTKPNFLLLLPLHHRYTGFGGRCVGRQ